MQPFEVDSKWIEHSIRRLKKSQKKHPDNLYIQIDLHHFESMKCRMKQLEALAR